MLQQFIIPAIGIGLSAGVLPGPLQAYLINVSLTHGFRKGIWVIFAPLIVDIPVAIIIVLILGQLPPEVINIIRVAGGLFLLWIAWGAWKQYQVDTSITVEEVPPASNLRILATAVTMSFLSPGPYLFWGTVIGPKLVDGLSISLLYGIAYLVAFYGTFLSILAILVVVMSRLGQLDAAITRKILLFTIGLLVWFGTSLIAEGLGIVALQQQLGIIVIVGLIIWFGIRTFTRKRKQGQEYLA